MLTERALQWGADYGWHGRREVAGVLKRRGDVERVGRLDVVFDRPGMPCLAVEIDRGNKAWSAEKLQAETMAGSAGIWLRWGSSPRRLTPPRLVVLVPFKTTSRKTEQGRLYTRQA
jgi:hypothetical protein